MGSITSGLAHLSGWAAYAVVAALVFGETAVFLGFVLPGEAAVVLGGVLASHGHVSIVWLVIIVVLAAVLGPLVGYEVGRRMGDRLFAARALRRIPGGVDRARSTLQAKGGLGVLIGRFVAILRAIVPAAAGAAQVPYRTFLIFNAIGGIIWGVGYCLLGYLAGFRLRGHREEGRHRSRDRHHGDYPRRGRRVGGAQAPRHRPRLAGPAGPARGTDRHCGAAFLPCRGARRGDRGAAPRGCA